MTEGRRRPATPPTVSGAGLDSVDVEGHTARENRDEPADTPSRRQLPRDICADVEPDPAIRPRAPCLRRQTSPCRKDTASSNVTSATRSCATWKKEAPPDTRMSSAGALEQPCGVGMDGQPRCAPESASPARRAAAGRSRTGGGSRPTISACPRCRLTWRPRPPPRGSSRRARQRRASRNGTGRRRRIRRDRLRLDVSVELARLLHASSSPSACPS